MKPYRFHFFLGLLLGGTAHSGDLLRGGSGAPNKPGRAAVSGAPTPAATDAARANAKDTLARTTRTLDAMRAMQSAARDAAIRNGGNHLGKNVPDGLAPGGLAPTPAKWTGANQPVQQTKNGRTLVTVKQTAQQALLEWQTLNVGRKTTLTFDQKAGGSDSGKWVVFNKITDPSGNPTQILGNIKADGQVYLINSNGIIFGGGSQVNARGLTASSLPISQKLINTGLLNNPDTDFLFDGLGLTGKAGDVVVEAGAKISSPVANDGNGGRVFLVGANVTNHGTISTPAGQTILAAGLQVGILAHSGGDPAIRGLDVFVGAISDPSAGIATNLGLIEAARGNVTITGRTVNQLAVVESSTTVSLNGSVNLSASYGAVKNTGYSSENPSTGNPFNYTAAGTVTFGEGSVTRILPDYQSKDTTTGTALALRSQIDTQGTNIYLAKDAEIFAPNAKVSFKTGTWTELPTGPFSTFLQAGGQIYLDGGARINLAGTVDASASVLQNHLTVTLRGSELSAAPLQRDGVLRGDTIVVDVTQTGTYNGQDWVGTPLADVSGYLNLIERDVAQLTTAGGTLDLSAGGSVVIRDGARIDVSGGWTNFTGDTVQTTRLWSGGRLIDIASATPDQVYDGIFTGTSTFSTAKWGVSETFVQAIAPAGKRYQEGFTQGANAGGISISTPAVALDGSLLGTSVAGVNQTRPGKTSSHLPATGSLSIRLEGQLLSGSVIYTHAPTSPTVVFGNGAQENVADFDPNSSVLSAGRTGTIHLPASLVAANGFGNLTVVNEGGDIVLPENVTLASQAGSRLSLTAANIDLLGSVISPGGTLSFNALNLTSYERALLLSEASTPPANAGRGIVTLGSSAILDTKGLLTDDRVPGVGALAPIILNGGSINIAGFSADLKSGGVIDVSGGYLLDAAGKGTFGKGGSITVEAGRDKASPTVIGGTLTLNSTLLGYAGPGKKGGTLSLQAAHVQIGGSPAGADTLLLQPAFFDQGGLSDFRLTGLGIGSRPGVLVTAGTLLAPVVKSWEAAILPAGAGELFLRPVTDIVGSRTPVNLTLSSPVLRSLTTVEVGDVVVENGAVIRTDPGGSVVLTGGTVSIFGSIIAPGGAITAGGGSTSVLDPSSPVALVTTLIGPQAVLSATGAVIRTPDNFGRRTGRILSGGTISLTGNIAASTGAIIDVSGTSAMFDIDPDTATPAGTGRSTGNGLVSLPKLVASVPVRLDGSAGSISLIGNELLLTDATLRGEAGGNQAQGGLLTVASKIFSPLEIPLPSAVNLTVSQAGGAVASGIGAPAAGGGRFAVDSFSDGGFDSLSLGGVVSFQGKVSITARRELSVGSGGFLYADGSVKLTAPHVTLGLAQPVVLPANETSPFAGSVLPTSGNGDLVVNASLIDLGHLSLQQFGKAMLQADRGDIRGSGIFQIAGELTLKAGQIHPLTASKLTFIAYDSATREGRIDVLAAGSRNLPLAAGGTLSFYSSTIFQQGTLRAPFGTINLGWDGTGTRPVDLLAGIAAGGVFPITKNLSLGSGSVTSVSAVDPVSGKGITIPYGISTDGEDWIDPRGVDITGLGAPVKNVVLSGVSVTTAEGSTIDLRGGGDLYAYRWVKGLGGPTDILAADTRFAILPSYQGNFAPVSEYNTANREENLISGYKGYTNESLAVGDRIYLSASDSLPAGEYTLLPARYALLPGAVLITPAAGSGSATVEMPDSSSLVSGFRFNSLNPSLTPSTLSTRFEVATSKIVRERAEYEKFLGNTFFKRDGGSVSRLPLDSGLLVFQASQAMEILGKVASSSVAKGRGASIDISTPLATVITSGTRSPLSGTVFLDSETLDSFGAESLLIGGRRSVTAAGTQVTVSAGSVTVDNKGSTLAAQDLVLVAKERVTLEQGASLASSGTLSGADSLLLSGDGALLRLSADKNAGVLRSGISSTSSAQLAIGAGVKLEGGGLTLDSSAGISLDPTADLGAVSYRFNAGKIALLLGNLANVTSNGGLVISNNTLGQLQSASALKLLSYSSIDLHGSGSFGSLSGLANLTLSAGEIRGLNPTGTARIAAGNLRIENSAAVAATKGLGMMEGNLELVGETISLGSHDIAINGYSSVLLDASRGIIGEGTGGLTVQGNLTARTPVLAGSAGAIRSLGAGGFVSLVRPDRASTGPLVSGLGSSLTVTGRRVNVDTAISLPSGSLTLRATSGNLAVGGLLDVSGTSRSFHDVTRTTRAGNIVLAANSGDVVLGAASKLDLSSQADGGALSVITPEGSFVENGSIDASGSAGRNGSFTLDVRSLPSLAALNSTLRAAKLTEAQTIRVRTGDVLVNGTATSRDFRLSADRGSITVTGSIDASGETGGSIHLAARGDLITRAGSRLTVAGIDFSSAGKGGSITLESGTQLDGASGTGSLEIRAGSILDLSVAAKVAGPASERGTSAYNGKFSGKLHLRAPRTPANTDLLVAALDGTILDASSILVEGYKLYDLTATSGTITGALQTSIRNDSTAFLGAPGSTIAGYNNITNRLLANNPGLAARLVLAPGVEILNRSGDLTLGSASSTTTSDWNLAADRYGPKSAAGVLTLRAAGNLHFYNALSDGFAPTLANTDTAWLWTARLSPQGNLLPVNEQSWSYRLTAGADLGAASFGEVVSIAGLAADKGSLKLGKTGTNISTSSGVNATTASAIANRFQVIRTGSGDIDIHAARDVQLLNQFATIYTAGTRVADVSLGGLFRIPLISNVSSGALGGNQQTYAVQYSMAGGNVNLRAGEDIERLTLSAGQLVADSQFQMPTNWLYRRGYVDDTGAFGTDRFNFATSTTWWVDFSNFFQGVGALGGGNATLVAGRNVSNVDAVIPTNARMPGYTDSTQSRNATPDISKLVELGGGDLVVRAGNDIDAGVYYIERGRGTLRAGGEILTNATRSVLNRTQTLTSSFTRLPTTLFLGKGGFDVSANGSVLLGPVANPFLLPAGQLNSFYNKSTYSTYSADSRVTVSSLGGDVTLRESAAEGGVTALPILRLWYENKLRLTTLSAAANKPWLRLAETSIDPFSTLFTLHPGTVEATSFSGNINLVGNLLLSPSAHGNVSLLAGNSINGLQPNGVLNLNGVLTTSWGSSRINLSDADPSSIPGVARPYGYQTLAGTSTAADTTLTDFLGFLNLRFAESGGTLGNNATLQTKQNLHAPGLLHADDAEPLRLYAGAGDVSGLVLFSPKSARVIAGQDISDISFYIQNTAATDTSVVSSARDLLPFTQSSALRGSAVSAGNILNGGSLPLDGDIQISGPGTLQVLAGRDLDLGTGSNNADGTGTGITSIGNTRNPYLPESGANLVVSAGIGPATGLSGSALDLARFIETYVLTEKGAKYLEEISPGVDFAKLSNEEQARLAIGVFNRILRDAGRDSAKLGNYQTATAAIEVLFGTDGGAWDGDILTRSRDIRTSNGGDIDILTPGGGLTLASTTTGSTLAPPGIITAAGGNISIFAHDDVNIGIGRIFTLRGGNEIIWSSKGDIAAGSSSKTVQTASPTRVRIDPQSATVQTDLSGLATGGGIGVLNAVKGVKPGDVDLIAPEGTVDAGDAGIRVSGNLNIAANLVLNAANISVGGSSAGTPAPVAAAASVSTVTSASNTAAAAATTTQAAAPRDDKPSLEAGTAPSIFTVEVIGYGGDDDEEEAEDGR